jgi:hypothetical protein
MCFDGEILRWWSVFLTIGWIFWVKCVKLGAFCLLLSVFCALCLEELFVLAFYGVGPLEIVYYWVFARENGGFWGKNAVIIQLIRTFIKFYLFRTQYLFWTPLVYRLTD